MVEQTDTGNQHGGEGIGALSGGNVTPLEPKKRGPKPKDKTGGDKPKADELKASDTHVIMRRDLKVHPAPHRAHVHRGEIENYAKGGWEIDSE